MAKTMFYQIYSMAWRDLKEMTEHLTRIADLGVDYVWLTPIYSSPRYDHGYDVEDYKSIDIRFGSMEHFDIFVDKAHELGMKVLMDLVLNHTSIYHPWFKYHPEYYCWDSSKRPAWHNLFDNGSAWQFDSQRQKYYLHLFHRTQADLNWFAYGDINDNLAREFRGIVHFWTKQHNVDGFRLDFPQALNKLMFKPSLTFDDLLLGKNAIKVINAIFPPNETDLMLIAECFDPTSGDVIDTYAKETAISFVLDASLKDSVKKGIPYFESKLEKLATHHNFLLELESHDSPRFPSVSNMQPEEIIWQMFTSAARGICLYQGQELGLRNPTVTQLPDEDLLRLDAMTLMRYSRGESLYNLRRNSRANARIHLPMSEYEQQAGNPSSYYNLTKTWIKSWKNW